MKLELYMCLLLVFFFFFYTTYLVLNFFVKCQFSHLPFKYVNLVLNFLVL